MSTTEEEEAKGIGRGFLALLFFFKNHNEEFITAAERYNF